MAKTATVHNPTHFDPADYEVRDYVDNHRPEFFGQSADEYAEELRLWEADMLRLFGADWRRKIHHCVHCGNGMVRWITAVEHLPTQEVVVFGATCTERLGFANKHAFKLAQLQARAEARKARFTIYTKRQAFLATRPDVAEALATIDNPVHAKNLFAHDVLRKLDQYGELSEKQIASVLTSLQRDREYAARRTAEESEPKGDAPSGRVVVTGTVLSTKDVESQYGWTTKMLLKLENNARAWLTVPSGSEIERGDTVTVRATFEVSRDDKSFAFGKRPTLVSRMAAAEVAR